jgi:hypothetical protein
MDRCSPSRETWLIWTEPSLVERELLLPSDAYTQMPLPWECTRAFSWEPPCCGPVTFLNPRAQSGGLVLPTVFSFVRTPDYGLGYYKHYGQVGFYILRKAGLSTSAGCLTHRCKKYIIDGKVI